MNRFNLCKTVRLGLGNNMEMCSYLSSQSTNHTDSNKRERPIYTPENPVSFDNPPNTCCMSGCPNCVYIEWAEALSKQMASGDPKIAKKILENVEDPSMRAFLQMELRNLGLL